jgi:hypothetical protein
MIFGLGHLALHTHVCSLVSEFRFVTSRTISFLQRVVIFNTIYYASLPGSFLVLPVDSTVRWLVGFEQGLLSCSKRTNQRIVGFYDDTANHEKKHNFSTSTMKKPASCSKNKYIVFHFYPQSGTIVQVITTTSTTTSFYPPANDLFTNSKLKHLVFH